MKPREHGGVVDTRLNVYGVEGLKVIGERPSTGLTRRFSDLQRRPCPDLSIAPGNVAAVCPSYICQVPIIISHNRHTRIRIRLLLRSRSEEPQSSDLMVTMRCERADAR